MERWLNEREIKKLLSSDTNASGTVVFFDRRLRRSFKYSGEGHTLLNGVSGVGKTRRGIIPLLKTIVDAKESFLVTVTKDSIYETIRPYIQDEDYNVYVLNFQDSSKGMAYNPFRYIYELYHSPKLYDRKRADELIGAMAESLYQTRDTKELFLPLSARSLFTALSYALLNHAREEEVNFLSIYNMVREEESTWIDNSALKAFTNELPQHAIERMLLENFISTAKETKVGIMSVFLEEGIAKFIKNISLRNMTCTSTGFQINNLADSEKANAIFIVLPDFTGIYNDVTGILINQITNHMIALSDKAAAPLHKRFNVVLEELGQIAGAFPNLPYLMASARSRNLRCVICLQNGKEQLYNLYGQSDALTIVSNCDIQIFYRTSDINTINEISERCGNRDKLHLLITPSEIASLATGQILVEIKGKHFVSTIPDFTELDLFSNPPNSLWQLQPTEMCSKEDLEPKIAVFDIKAATRKMLLDLEDNNSRKHKSPFGAMSYLISREELNQMRRDIEARLKELDGEDEDINPQAEMETLGMYEVVMLGLKTPESKVKAIKEVREFFHPSLGLKESHELVSKMIEAPFTVRFALEAEAEAFIKTMKEAGIIIEALWTDKYDDNDDENDDFV